MAFVMEAWRIRVDDKEDVKLKQKSTNDAPSEESRPRYSRRSEVFERAPFNGHK